MRIDAALVAKLRKQQNWSQDELAIAAGLHPRTVQRVENTGLASLQTRKSLAAALAIDVATLSHKEQPMSQCPECHSKRVYRLKALVDSQGGLGPESLPGLGGWFSSAQVRPYMCADCGNLRYFAAPEAMEKVVKSSRWESVS